MKKQYQSLIIDVKHFTSTDVITSSSEELPPSWIFIG